MKIANTSLLLFEFLFCAFLFSGKEIAFGYGERDFWFFGFIYLWVIVHLVWTFRIVQKSKNYRFPVIISKMVIFFILLKASFLRGAEFPWDGDLIVNQGRLKPDLGNNITYTVTKSNRQKDTIIKINVPDPKNKYLTTLWVSDPECTGCNDCMLDSGKILIPDTLKDFGISSSNFGDILLLEGKSPYEIQGEPYVSYKIKGQAIGVREGKVIFYVSEWSRR
jgi:hypothetical protein